MSEFNLFVYGTLRYGGSGAERLAGCRRLADATIGGTLYDIDGRFPALLYYGTDPVEGEVWRCPADLLLKLDAYEGTASGLFRRIGVELKTSDGAMAACWVYTAGPALSRHLLPRNRVIGAWRPRISD